MSASDTPPELVGVPLVDLAAAGGAGAGAAVGAAAGVAEDSASFFFFFLLVFSVLSCADRTFVVRSVTENTVANANSLDHCLIEASPLHEVVGRDLDRLPDRTHSTRTVRRAGNASLVDIYLPARCPYARNI